MKKTALLLLLFLLVFTGKNLFAQAPGASECGKFHTGTYYYKDIPGVIVERDSLTQTERDPATGRYVTMSIKWTGECSYELRLIKTNDKHDRKFWKKVKVLVVNITYVEENTYRFTVTSAGLPDAIRGTMTKK